MTAAFMEEPSAIGYQRSAMVTGDPKGALPKADG